MLERELATVLVARHNHACHPEEDDVRTRYEVAGRIIVADFLVARMVDAVEDGNRPQPA